MPTTRCEYHVTLDDFRRSLRAWRKRSKRKIIAYALNIWIAPTLFTIIAAWLCFECFLGSLDKSFLVVAFAFLCFAGSLPLTLHLRIRRAYKQRVAVMEGKAVTFEFDEGKASFTNLTGAEIRYQWQIFTGFTEDDQVATLFIRDALFHTIPKRAMAEDSWDLLRSYVLPHLDMA